MTVDSVHLNIERLTRGSRVFTLTRNPFASTQPECDSSFRTSITNLLSFAPSSVDVARRAWLGSSVAVRVVSFHLSFGVLARVPASGSNHKGVEFWRRTPWRVIRGDSSRVS